jgi:hypothetical protein
MGQEVSLLVSGYLPMLLGLDDLMAVWGAATGTVALLIHLRNLRKDTAKVRVSTRLDDSAKSLDRLEVDVVNLGRRPIHIEAVSVQVTDKVGKRRSQSQEVCRGDNVRRELKESEGVTLCIDDLLPEYRQYDYYQIYRVGVRDRSGKVWWSRRKTVERSVNETGSSICIAEAEFNPYPESNVSVSLLMFQNCKGYVMVYPEEGSWRFFNRSQQFRTRGPALRAFNREKLVLEERMEGIALRRAERR